MSDDRADLTLTCQQTVTGVPERSHAEDYNAIGNAAEAVAAHRVRKL
jgi:hypothetical protein